MFICISAHRVSNISVTVLYTSMFFYVFYTSEWYMRDCSTDGLCCTGTWYSRLYINI